jgi:2-dehydrotetronate isomerase
MKFAANLSSLWAELPYLDRFEAASAAGFQGVAVPLPYEIPAKDTKRACLRSGLPVVQISTPPPNYTGGERGFAAVPGLEARFRYDLRRALRYCAVLRVPILHVMAGVAQGDAARATLVSNLRHAVQTVPDGLCLTLQPQAQDGAFLSDFGLAADVVKEVGSNRLGLQFHSYHAQTLHADAVAVFRTYSDIIRHVQLADAPDAGPPGTGALDFAELFAAMEKAGYAGWIVADYLSGGPTEDTLDWMPKAYA